MATVKLNTTDFGTMLSKVSKCTAKGGLAIIAELVEMRLTDGILSLRTTDTRNTMVLRKSGVAGDNFIATIPIDVFANIVNKTSKEEVTLTIDDKAVTLVGNGTYKFPLTIEGDAPVIFEPLKPLAEPETKQTLKRAELLEAMKYTCSTIGSPFVYPAVSGYYFGDIVMTSDMTTCSYYNQKFFEKPVMFYPTTLELLKEVDDEQIMFLRQGRKIQFISSSCLIESVVHSDLEEFPADILAAYFHNKNDDGSDLDMHKITCSKAEAKGILDRVSFFVDMKSEFGATVLDFTKNGLVISDRGGKAVETLPIKSENEIKEVSCYIGVNEFQKALEVDESGDEIALSYDGLSFVRVDTDKVARVVALIDPGDIDSAIDFGNTADEVLSTDAEVAAEPTFAEAVEGDLMADIVW